MKRNGELWCFSRPRQSKFLNNVVEQDHRRVKRLVRPGLGFGGFRTAQRTLAGYEAMAVVRKGQVRRIGGRGMRAQAVFIAELFQIAACPFACRGHSQPAAIFAPGPGRGLFSAGVCLDRPNFALFMPSAWKRAALLKRSATTRALEARPHDPPALPMSPMLDPVQGEGSERHAKAGATPTKAPALHGPTGGP